MVYDQVYHKKNNDSKRSNHAGDVLPSSETLGNEGTKTSFHRTKEYICEKSMTEKKKL